NEEAALVNRPTPASAKGQMAGHISELASPNSAIHATETYPSVKMAPSPSTTPKIAQNFKALSCLIYLGMAIIPTIQPTTMSTIVPRAKYFAVANENPSEVP